jgi:hypothetical protein
MFACLSFNRLKCPSGHRLTRATEHVTVDCDLCGLRSTRKLQCKKCNDFSVCIHCEDRLRCVKDIMCPTIYHGGYFPTCAEGHQYFLDRKRFRRDDVCVVCSKTIPTGPSIFVCFTCVESMCVRCYRYSVKNKIARAQQSSTVCTYCRLDHRVRTRVRETCKTNTTCTTCAASLKGMMSFRCPEHEFSVLCLRCRLKEKRGIALPREHGIALRSEDAERLCRVGDDIAG